MKEPFLTIARTLTRNLTAILTRYADRPSIPDGLLSGEFTIPLPPIARNPSARAAITAAITQSTPHHHPFPELTNHPGGTITWRLLAIDPGHTLRAAYTILTPLGRTTQIRLCRTCRFCHPCHDPLDLCPPHAAFCDCPTTAGGDGIPYAITATAESCHLYQPQN